MPFRATCETAALWSLKQHGKLALPAGYAEARIYRDPADCSSTRLYVRVTTEDDGLTYSAQLLDELGNIFVTLDGYRTVSAIGNRASLNPMAIAGTTDFDPERLSFRTQAGVRRE